MKLVMSLTSHNHVCWQEVVPSHLVTSPIISRGEELMESQLGRRSSRQHGRPWFKKNTFRLWKYVFNRFCSTTHPLDSITCSSLPVQNLGPQQSDGGMTKKRRKRRRKPRPEGGVGGGGGKREGSGEEFSEDEDMFTIDLSSDEEGEADRSRYMRKLVILCVGRAEKAKRLWWSVFIFAIILEKIFLHVLSLACVSMWEREVTKCQSACTIAVVNNLHQQSQCFCEALEPLPITPLNMLSEMIVCVCVWVVSICTAWIRNREELCKPRAFC